MPDSAYFPTVPTPPQPEPTPEPKPNPKPFKMEAVVVSAGYDDFLQETLPTNKHLFNRIVVVTSPEDTRTQRVCEWNHVECLVTDVLQTRWKKFCKGSGINVGLDALDKDGWVMHLDADIWLPPQTRILLEQANLDPTMLYGADRFMVRSFAEWREFIETPRLQHENSGWIHMNAFPLGTRVMGKQGYIPIGFLQLFSPTGSGVYKYPAGHTDAGREDGLFAQLWSRAKRHLLPEITGYHLESEPARMGSNWEGRRTKRFGYDKESK